MRRCWGTTPVFQTEEPTGVEGAQWSGGPGRGSRRRQLHTTLTYFACNSPEQQSMRAQKPQNINDPISKLEIWAGELHATLLGNHSGISNGRTHRLARAHRLERTRRSGGPGCGADTRHRESPQTNFARNLTRSFFEIAHKRCNSNDANSIFEPVGAELRAKLLSDERDNSNPVPPTGASSSPARQHNTRPRPVSRPRPRHAHAAALSEAPPIRRSCPRDPRPRRGQPRGGQRGRGTASRTRSPGPRHGRSGSTPGRHRARRTRRA